MMSNGLDVGCWILDIGYWRYGFENKLLGVVDRSITQARRASCYFYISSLLHCCFGILWRPHCVVHKLKTGLTADAGAGAMWGG